MNVTTTVVIAIGTISSAAAVCDHFGHRREGSLLDSVAICIALFWIIVTAPAEKPVDGVQSVPMPTTLTMTHRLDRGTVRWR